MSVGEALKQSAVALAGAPVLLVIVLLNITMVGGAAYYLLRQEEFRHTERMAIMERCFAKR